MRNYLLSLLPLSLVSPLYTHKITLLPQYHRQLAFNKPATFGKTHFIVGYQQDDQRGSASAPSSTIEKNNRSPVLHGQICDVFFAPNDNINRELLSLIDQEQKHIRVAVFNFTDRNIAQALIRAQDRGVVVEVITDINCIYDRYNKIDQLHDNNISVLIFDPKQKKAGGIMHHKFALFSNNRTGNALVWTGSCNFTRSGSQVNQENGLLLNDEKIVNKFLQQFERIKKQSHSYKPLFRRQLN